jgi:ABC-type sulfate/molybdate transport systems ATPase subunit
MPLALEVRDLWKTYVIGIRGCSARVAVLCGVELQIARGERVGLLGRPASGKTTLLHCLAGLRRPDSGIVRLHDGGPESLVLLDEGQPVGTPRHRAAAATLIVGRDLERLRDGVDRVLLLREGRIVPLDPPADTAPAPQVRRVAEPRLARGGAWRDPLTV